MSTSRRGILRWVEERINLTEIFSFFSTFGLAYGEIDTRKPLMEALSDAFRKPLPVYAQWPHVLGLLTFVLFLFQAFTGILLAFYYQPTPETAYDSVLLIIRDTSLGWYIHQMHFWGSNVLLVLVTFRLARFFLHGAYKPPRELVWVIAVVLFLLTAHQALIGDLLPWDQGAYWLVTRSLEILDEMPLVGPMLGFIVGGLESDEITLTRFYMLHIIVIPLAMFILFYLHFATVRRVGLSTAPAHGEAGNKPLYPDHLLNLMTVLLLLFGVLLALAVWFPAHFEAPADPFSSPADIRPPWYLLPAYGVIELLPAGVGGWVLFIGFSGLLLIPFVDRTAVRPARKRPLALFLFACVFAGVTLAGYLGYVLRG